MEFHGHTEHSLDAKHRLTVPSKYRAALGARVYLVKEVDRCVSVWPEETYSAIIASALSGLNPVTPQAKQLKRYFSSRAELVDIDSAGRVMVPRGHLEHAGIGRQASVVGATDSLELWEPGNWKAYETDLSALAPDLTEALGHPA